VQVKTPVHRFLVTRNEISKPTEVSTKRLANLVDVAAEIGRRGVQLRTCTGDQFRIHGPSFAALPHLVNVAAWRGHDYR
jgi:hypothetical protein